jgi:nucleotide-binding universal stress UspA family protein
MNFPPKNILVPTDFSEGSEAALAYAFDLATKVGAKVHLLHAYMIPVFLEDGGAMRRLMDDMHALGEKTLNEVAEKYKASDAIGERLLKTGDPRDQIIQSAVELHADLIVMGTHGRRGIKRMLIGSVAEAVARTAPCAVLVVPVAKPSKN